MLPEDLKPTWQTEQAEMMGGWTARNVPTTTPVLETLAMQLGGLLQSRMQDRIHS